MSHDLSHSHSQLQGFQVNPLSHIPLSINSLHSHLHLSLFRLYLLLKLVNAFTSFMLYDMYCFIDS